MNAEKMTQKTREAITSAQSIAIEKSHQQISQMHLLYALASQEDGLIGSLLGKMNINKNAFLQAIMEKINAMPSVYVGNRPSDQIYITADLDRAINSAEKTAQQMKDSYVSVEHLMLGIIDEANDDVKNTKTVLA
jgi:ATP-dependent Clp protease ATP-binding subunit ClpB